ncbi:MAG: DUF2314 domain-containing protein [Phycisphaerales bacterium JB050]
MRNQIIQRGQASRVCHLGLVAVLACGAVASSGCEERSESVGHAEVSLDREMLDAVNEGRATLPLFVKAFRDPREDWLAFQIRHSFKTGDGFSGAVWLELESIEADGSFIGVVAEDEDARGIPFEPGERLTVDASQVTDWSFLDSRGRWYGGYTLRVVMDRSLGTGVDATDNIHGGTEFVDLDKPEPSDGDGDGLGGAPD